MPVETEVSAGDGKVSGNGQFLTWAQAEQGAVVAYAETQGTQGGMRRAAANLAKQGLLILLGFVNGTRPP